MTLPVEIEYRVATRAFADACNTLDVINRTHTLRGENIIDSLESAAKVAEKGARVAEDVTQEAKVAWEEIATRAATTGAAWLVIRAMGRAEAAVLAAEAAVRLAEKAKTASAETSAMQDTYIRKAVWAATYVAKAVDEIARMIREAKEETGLRRPR